MTVVGGMVLLHAGPTTTTIRRRKAPLMPRHRLYLAALLSSLLGAWLAVDIGRLAWSNQAPSTVYSLAALRASVEHAPAHWLGRTVVVRALAEPCPWWGEMARLQHCAGQPLALLGT